MKKNRWNIFVTCCVVPLVVVGCVSNHLDASKIKKNKKKTVTYPLTEHQCLMRAMYFESNRTSREGMIAVGTVVMNRVNSTAYPKTICGVVGQYKQFAPGVLTRPMTEKASVARAKEAADAVLRGERDKRVRHAKFFHTAGLSFPYRNMHYVRIAGGNAFYEKRSPDGSLQVPTNNRPYDVAYAFAQEYSGNVPSFVDEGLESREIKTEKSASPSTQVTQSKTIHSTSFAMVQLDKVPIPTYAPQYLARKEENKSFMVLPSSDQLNAIVAMLEKRYTN
ncbi:spore germination cell wall hydrolase CwlJ-like protein [Bartonella fuyuanensis]|uniref:Spore germination cell wall hydrolase CwlJ-like protein n=1 Tax=Bartonella fuyuanensis TaxID=1460968 RepID=A0A840E5W6_9HYPH|nr:cell wall hydrolase [Bartonella fuyuanensis]MBB4076536.1 spore germination cell wall hydrolase CwlJ-like protein [Bartonella fuyuanensis]